MAKIAGKTESGVAADQGDGFRRTASGLRTGTKPYAKTRFFVRDQNRWFRAGDRPVRERCLAETDHATCAGGEETTAYTLQAGGEAVTVVMRRRGGPDRLEEVFSPEPLTFGFVRRSCLAPVGGRFVAEPSFEQPNRAAGLPGRDQQAFLQGAGGAAGSTHLHGRHRSSSLHPLNVSSAYRLFLQTRGGHRNAARRVRVSGPCFGPESEQKHRDAEAIVGRPLSRRESFSR